MKLNLKRPLAFFDLEATGVNVGADRIVEIAVLKAMPDGTEQIWVKKINPEMPIPLVTSLIHGIYDEDIKKEILENFEIGWSDNVKARVFTVKKDNAYKKNNKPPVRSQFKMYNYYLNKLEVN